MVGETRLGFLAALSAYQQQQQQQYPLFASAASAPLHKTTLILKLQASFYSHCRTVCRNIQKSKTGIHTIARLLKALKPSSEAPDYPRLDSTLTNLINCRSQLERNAIQKKACYLHCTNDLDNDSRQVTIVTATIYFRWHNISMSFFYIYLHKCKLNIDNDDE